MRTLLVTGATSGVGLETVRSFIEKGWVAIGLARNQDRLKDIQTLLGDNFFPFTVDVSKPASVAQCFEVVSRQFPTLDLLVNNAAVFKLSPFDQCSIEDIDRIIDTNLKGTLYCTYFALKLLTRGSGRIVNISSVAGIHGIKNQAIYCASKFGVDGFSEALGQELAERGLSMTTICPGGIDTPLWNHVENPYPGGDVTHLLKSKDIVALIDHIVALPSNVVMKKMITFPSNEWH